MNIIIHQTYLSELGEKKVDAEKLIKAALLIECSALSQEHLISPLTFVVEEVEVTDVEREEGSEDDQPIWLIQVGILLSIYESISLFGYQHIKRTLAISWV